MKMGQQDARALTRREKWPDYLAGAITEIGFILCLTTFALIMAVVALVVF